MSTKNTPALLPVISCLVAATLWGVLWYPMRLLESLGVPGLWATLMIYVAALIPLLPAFWDRRHDCRNQGGNLIVIAVFSGWTNLAFILALLEGTVVRVLLLFYLSPVWTVILGWIILREYLKLMSAITVMIAMTGAIIMLWPGEAEMFWPLHVADWLAISAGIAFAVMNVFLRRSGDIPLIVKMVPACVGVIVLAAAGLVLLGPALPTLTPETILLAFAVGGIGIIAMTYTAQYGVTHMPVHRSAVIFLFEIVAGAVSAALLTDEIMTPREWFGGLLVIIAAWLTATGNLESREG